MNGEMRSTYVDADEARMMRALRRFRGDDTAREAGNNYSKLNRERQAALAERNAGKPPPPPPEPKPPARRGLEPHASRRAVPVPRPVRNRGQRPAAIDLVPKLGKPPETISVTGNMRPDYSEYEPAPLPPYRPPQETRDMQKERLQDRLTYGDAAPSRVLPEPVAAAPPPRLSERDEAQQLADAITGEIEERQAFLEEMSALGKRDAYEAQIKGEIAVRIKELERVDRLLAAGH
eukprot:CAMPEP_0119416546 /NCGR_PEP_ID=MMETSP1335-20130426/13223_1 /TAXON_ID=259385 /ORGANISM="Chrysoculter rhomboideus, Strain RCC1486" /LENGTH=233 /DNA_ID=CAMNT_0007441675 /DNA_START=9 /DNA_END=710 /DNA_ORIENTATION=-